MTSFIKRTIWCEDLPEDLPRGACAMGGGGAPKVVQGPPQTTTTKSEPWEGLQPYLREALGMAQTAAGQTSTTPFGGELTAPVTEAQKLANQMRVNFATGGGIGDVGQSAINLAQETLQGKYLTPESNPYFAQGLQATVKPLVENLKYEALPQLSADAWNAGAYGGDRYNIEQARRISGTESTIADTAAKAYADLYTRERQNQMQAPGLAQAGVGLGLIPSDILSAAGTEQRQWAQEPITEAMTRYQMAQQAPWQAVKPYADILQGLPVSGGTQSQTGTPSQFYQPTSMGASMLSGALGGGSMGASLAPLLGFGGPWGAGIGALGGLLLGGLG